MKKRIIAAILSCCMLLGTCGVAYAEEDSSNMNADGAVVISDDVDENQEVDADTEDDAETSEDESDSLEEVDYDEDDDLEDIASNYTMEEDEIVQVDEYGNVTIVDPSQIGDGVVDVPMIATYANTEQIVNFRANAKGTAIPTNCFVSYTEYKTGKSGYINGVAGADAAYLGTQNGKVKFMMSGVIGLVDQTAVQVVSMDSIKSYSYYDTDGTYLYHRICTDMSTPGYASSINVGKTPSYLKAGTTYYSYDGHYFYTNYSTMLSDYRADTRSHAVNAGNPYYNYFQYLPLRSATSYSGSELSNTINGHTFSNSKMYNMGNVFVEKQNLYGTNALLVASIGALESAWGTSAIAQAKNNLFGWNAVDATPGPSASYFASSAACIDEYTGIHLSQGYLRAGYSTYHGAFLGNKSSGMNVSYASDPYWGEKIAGIAWNMDRERGSKDQYKYKLGIKDTVTYNATALNVRSEATTSSTVLYQTGNNAHYSFIILGESNGFYKIQSDSVLNSARTAVVSNSGNYNAAKMYAYASKDYIKVVNNGNGGNSDSIIGNASLSGTTGEDKLISYTTHVQKKGWTSTVAGGQISGSVGSSLRLEGIKISLNNVGYSGSVEYKTHVQTYGWQDWVSNGQLSGTSGEAKRLEAIRIRLTGDVANHYDIYYRVHTQTYGWLDWAKNGELAGSEGGSKRLEAIEIKLVKKGASAPGETNKPYIQLLVQYRSHVQTYGWQDYVVGNQLSGTSGQGKRLEAIQITTPVKSYSDNIEYQVHGQTYGWQGWRSTNTVAGSTGIGKRLEAIRIRLTGKMAENYDIYYRVHSQTYGWLDWAKNGEVAGTEGCSKRMESIQIVLVEKGESAPGSTSKPYIKK